MRTLVLLITLLSFFTLSAPTVQAVCDPITNPEFHPLRPYPGSPCDADIPQSVPEASGQTGDITFTCGKSINTFGELTFKDTDGYACATTENPNQRCLDKSVNYAFSLDLSPAQFPIIGNTELVGLTDAQKANYFLDWYLNGTVQQSEQKPIDPNNPIDVDRLINYSGPLKKLLPFDAQQNLRRTLASGFVGTDYHNYIVGCQKNLDLDYLRDLIVNTIKTNVDLGVDGAKVGAKLIFLNWESLAKLANLLAETLPLPISTQEKISIIVNAQISNVVSSDLELVSLLVAMPADYWTNLKNQMSAGSFGAVEICATSDVTKRLTDIKANLPPNPSNYTTFEAYWHAYQDWRGVIDLGLFGSYQNLLAGSLWAQLFKQVPFSSLEDTVGEVFTYLYPADQTAADAPSPNGIDKKNLELTITKSDSKLYFPHLRNVNMLTQVLTKLFRPSEQGSLDTTNDRVVSQIITNHENPANPNHEPAQGFLDKDQHDDRCDLKNVRYTPSGDKLYSGTIAGNLTYTQTFHFSPALVQLGKLAPGAICNDPTDCFDRCSSNNYTVVAVSGPPVYFCAAPDRTLESEGRIATFIKTPIIEKIYDTLVLGQNSLLRRFLPRLGDSQDGLSDRDKAAYPARLKKGDPDTSVVGASAIGVTASTSDLSNSQVSAGDKSGGAEIYFPYVGSIYNFILGGSSDLQLNLQKLLRPQGFFSAIVPNVPGAAIPIANNPSDYPTVGTPQLDCRFDQNQLMAAAGSAGQKYNVPASMLKAIYTIENGGQYSVDQSYTCGPNSAGAWGPTQITDLTYSDVTTTAERTPTTQCIQIPNKFNRCNIYDAMELTSKILLKKLGRDSSVGIKSCDLASIDFASCAYYGFDGGKADCEDTYTNNWKGRSEITNAKPVGPMTYSHIVCALMDQENPSLNYCPNYPKVVSRDPYDYVDVLPSSCADSAAPAP